MANAVIYPMLPPAMPRAERAPPLVQYKCRCGVPRELTLLYWCRHCPSLQCALCVSQEVDSFFCPSCSNENMPSTEAKTAANCCNQGCFQCPQCASKLEYIQGEEASDNKLLVCQHCRWNSGAIDLQGSKADIMKKIAEQNEGSYNAHFGKLVDQYHLLAKEEVRKQEQVKQTAQQASHRKGRGLYKYAAYKREGTKITKSKLKEKLADRINKRYDDAKNEWVDIVDTTEKNALMPTFESEISALTQADVNMATIDDVASLSQRFQNLAVQPSATCNVWPAPCKLLVKRSRRCRVCLHNMIKPELSPESIRYKMQLFASLHVPNLQFIEIPPLVVGEQATIVFVLSNPLDQAIEVVLSDTPSESAKTNVAPTSPTKSMSPTSLIGLPKSPDSTASPDTEEASGATPKEKLAPMSAVVREVSKFAANATITLPKGPLKVKEHDPVHEYQPEEASAVEEGDDACILKRKGNTIIFALTVTPQTPAEHVKVSFFMQYKYVVTTTGFRSTEKTATTVTHDVDVPVEINLGPLVATETAIEVEATAAPVKTLDGDDTLPEVGSKA
eukprot:m.152324 g.152324  ORF g.152324 m.152324 type:complete len:560 (-) comp30801_c5_seq1:68-1747(-)